MLRNIKYYMKKRHIPAVIAVLAVAAVMLCFASMWQAWFKHLANKPNILLITICSLRQDHLGCYGYRRNTSPNIDALANTSNIFKNCHTPIPWTKPSVIALLTGKYPLPGVLVENQPALSKRLHSAGYLNLAIVGTEVVREVAKADVGFDIFLDNSSLKTSKDKHTVQADTIVNEAQALLDKHQNSNQPVFLWLFFKDPHWPYMPPPGYGDKFINDDLYASQRQELFVNEHFHNSIGGIGEARLSKSKARFFTDKAYYISQYDAEIRYLDSEIGRIITYLKENRHYDDWVIVLLSDHGESLGEDNYFFDHGYKLSEATTKIPLIIKLPRQTKKRVVNYSVSICDLYPTLMKLAGLDRNLSKDNPGGENILSKNTYRKDRAILLENAPEFEDTKEKLEGCIWKPYKLIHNIATEEKTLYNISKGEERLADKDGLNLRVTETMNGFITSFFKSNKTHKIDSSGNLEALKSLGYL